MSSFALANEYKCTNEGSTEKKSVICKNSGNTMNCTEKVSTEKLTCTTDAKDSKKLACTDAKKIKKTCMLHNNETDVEEGINAKVANP